VWFLAGGAAGVYATSRVRKVTEALSYDGVHDRLTGWFAGARIVRDELRTGMAEKEAELRDRLALGEGATVLALPAGGGDDTGPGHSSNDDTPDEGSSDESRGHH
jgi:hypothetical protein